MWAFNGVMVLNQGIECRVGSRRFTVIVRSFPVWDTPARSRK